MSQEGGQRQRAFRTASDQRFRAVVETARDAIISADNLGNITSWNPAAAVLFGHAAADVIGRPLTMLMPERFRAAHRVGFARFLATGELRGGGRILELIGLHKDGREFALDLSLSVWGAHSSPSFTAIMRDITQRKRAEAVQLLQAQVANVLAESAALAQSAPKVLETICELLSGEVGNLWVVDESGEFLRCAASFCQPHVDRNAFVSASFDAIFLRGEGLPGRIWASAEPETTLDVAVARKFSGGPVTPPDGLRGACGFPIVAGRQVIGVLDFLSREPMLLDSELIAILRALGGQIGQFLRRKQTEEALAASEEKFRLLVESVREYAIFMLDTDGNIRTWNRGAERITGFVTSEIIGKPLSYLYDEEDLQLGRPERLMEAARLSGRASDEGWRVRKNGSRFWAEAVINSVHDAAGELRGFAKVTRDLTERRRAERNALRLAEEQAARTAAENAEQVALGQARTQQVLAEASRLFSSLRLDLDGTLQAVATRCAEAIGDACAVQIVGESGDHFYVRAFHHNDPRVVREAQRSIIGLRTPMAGLSKAVLDTKRALLVPFPTAEQINETFDEAWQPFFARYPIRSLIAVPLVVGNRVLGIVGLARHSADRPYVAADLALLQDLSDRAGLAIENARLYQDLRDAVEVRDDFLAVAGHELKTPLAAMLMHVQSLLLAADKGATVDQLPGRLERASRAGKRLAALVDQLLDVSRISAGKLRLETEPFDLVELAREVTSRFSETTTACPISVRAAPPLRGVWDRARIDQVLSNLISNALKYGKGKPIEIELGVEAGNAVMRVTDHGIGIEPDQQTRIFERFERATETREFGGFGLGLWIARCIVEASCGSISVRSTPGSGATFTVRLPIPAQQESHALAGK